MLLHYKDIRNIVSESVRQYLNEMSYFPKYGYCLIMVGAPGSGKSYVRDNLIPIQGKVFDIDDFRSQYKKINKNNIKVSNKEFGNKLKKQEALFLQNQGNIKNNIIFDIGGRPEGKDNSLIDEIIRMVKPYGYKIGICWVVSNRSVSLKRNIERKRTLPDRAIHQRTNQILNFIPTFLTSERAKEINSAWIMFTSGENLNSTNIPDTIKLQKASNGSFVISNDVINKIKYITGPLETGKNAPEVYLSNSEIKKNIDTNRNTYLRNENHNINGNLITEGFTDILYHFTTIKNLYNIIKNDILILTPTFGNTNDTILNGEKYKFYMSFTRERNSNIGYAGYMNHTVGNFGRDSDVSLSDMRNVRIEFDGRELSYNFKGKPVNYHFRKNAKNAVQQAVTEVELIKYRQSEDRLISNEHYIDGLSKFIKRIDVYIPLKSLNKKTDTLNKLYYCLNNSNLKDIINIYFNEKDFNSLNKNNNNIEFNKLLNNNLIDKNYSENNFKLTDAVINRLSAALSCILVYESQETVNNSIEYILSNYKKFITEKEYSYLLKKLIENVNYYNGHFNNINPNDRRNLLIYNMLKNNLRQLGGGLILNALIQLFYNICEKYNINTNGISFVGLRSIKDKLFKNK